MKNSRILLLITLITISNLAYAQIPTATFTATPTQVCACSQVTFTNTYTNSPTTWTWYLPGGTPSYTVITAAPGNPGPVTYCTRGVYGASLVVSNSFGSDSTSQSFAVIVEPLPKAKIYPPSGGICDTSGGKSYDTIYFNATGANTYTWLPANGLSCTNCANPHAYPNTSTVYTVTCTGTDGCVSIVTDTVLVGKIVASIWGVDTICPGNNDTLLASGGSSNPPGTTYLWSNGNTTSTIVVNPTINTTYSCTIVSGTGNCSSSASFTVSTSCTSGIEDIVSSNSIEVMPNPATTELTVLIKKPEVQTSQIIISDITGRMVYTQSLKPDQDKFEINISTLSKGMYFIQIKTSDTLLVKKFIKD